MRLQCEKSKGFSMVELMVSLLLGAILLVGMYSLFSSYLTAGFDTLRQSRLQMSLEQTMMDMNRELRRAVPEIEIDDSFSWNTNIVLKINSDIGEGMVITPGNPVSFPVVSAGSIGPILGAGPAYGNGRVQITSYNGSGASAHGNSIVEFTNMPKDGKLDPGEWFVISPNVTTVNSIMRIDEPGPSSGSCVLFTYDANKDTVINVTAGSDERYGYRLITVNGIGTVEKRTGGDFTDCNSGTWVAITDNKVLNITTLNFGLNTLQTANANGGCSYQQRVDVTLTGQLVQAAAVSRTLTQSVPLKNVQLNFTAC